MSQNRAPHVHRVRVYYEDTDAGGIVYHANYLKFAERGRSEMIHAMGSSNSQILADHGVIFVVKTVAIDYLAPARLEDDLLVKTTVTAIGNASFGLVQEIHRGAEMLTKIDVKLVTITPQGAVIRIPDVVRMALLDYVLAS
jgi:acyl-CoA thioester hydrolase